MSTRKKRKTSRRPSKVRHPVMGLAHLPALARPGAGAARTPRERRGRGGGPDPALLTAPDTNAGPALTPRARPTTIAHAREVMRGAIRTEAKRGTHRRRGGAMRGGPHLAGGLRLAGRSSSQKRSSSRRRSSSRSRHDRRPSPQRSRQRRSPPKRSHEESTAARKSQETSTSAETLAKKLLESSAVQSLSKESDVETMVKTLAPALLAELAKMKSTPSTSSKGSAAATSTAAGSSSSYVAANKKPSATKTTPGQQRADAARPKSVKASVPTILTLRSIPRTLAYEDILAAAEQCGKTKSVVVFRTKGEAVVCFENKEDADKLRNTRNPKIKGWPVFVVEDKESDSKVQKNNPEKNAPAPSKASKTQPSKSTSAAPAAQDKAKTVPSKQITKVVKKVPVQAKITPKVSGVKAQTSAVKPSGGAAGKKFDTTTPVAKTTQPGKTTKVPQQAMGKSKPPSKAVSHSQPPPEPMEVAPGVATEERNQQTIGAQAEPAGGPARAQGDSPDAERAAAQAKTITDAAPAEEPVSQPVFVKSEADGGSSLKGDEAVKEEAAPPRDSDTAAKKDPPTSGAKDHVAHPCGSDPTVKNEPQPGSNPTLKKDPATSGESNQLAQENLETSCETGTAAKNGSAASSDAAAKTGVALPHDSAERVKEEAPSHSPDASATKDAAKKSTAPPCGSKASSKKNAAPPVVFKTSRLYTVGEKMKEHLVPENLHIRTTCWKQEGSQMLITNLPADEHTYCEQDVIDVFKPFGMANSDDNIYVIPQLEIAFIQLKDYACVLSAIRASENGKLALKGHKEKLNAQVVDIPMWPGGFYQSVMMLLNYKVTKHGPKTVYIKNIEPSEVPILREVLRRICGIVNFMPLMNKVFVEFGSIHHVDRFGVWYSLHAQCPTYQIYRLGLPNVDKYSPKPRSPELAMPDSNAAFAEATLIDFMSDFPFRTASPFYLTLRRKPYLFSTISPWFIIPAFLTVKRKADIINAEFGGAAMVKTVMLTGLPQGCYTHEDVAKLAWPFLAKKDLRALYYNVIVLPAQRRAFVQFNDWNSCCNFVLTHLPSPLRVGRYILGVHLVLKSLYAERSKEADMYVALMRLSNSYVGEDLKTLSERLLCVEISEARKHTYYMVLDEVSSHAKIVNFLPLANRICIEMEDAAGVACVVEKCKDLKINEIAWKPVQSFCSAKRLEECLQDPRQITLNRKIYAVSASLSATPWTAPSAIPLPAPPTSSAAQTNTPSDAPPSSSAAQTATSSDAPLSSLAAQTETSSDSPPTSSDFPTAPSAVVVSNPGKPVEILVSAPCADDTAAKNDSDKVERSMAEKTIAVPEVQDNKEDATLPASTGGANDVPDVPDANNTSAAVDQDKEESLVKSDDALGDSEKDVSSNAVPFDQPPFNIDEFVTVDEVGDQEDSAGEAPSALKRSSSQAELPPASKRTKASTSKESKVSSSTPSPSSRATRSSTRMGLSSGFTPLPVSMSAKKRQRKQPKASQHQTILLSTTDCKDESLETMASEESYQVLDSVGDDQKPLSVEVGHVELSETGATELQASPEQDNIGQVDGVEEEQAPPVHTSQVEEQENRGGENEVTDVKEDGVGEELTAQSSQTNKDAAEEPTLAELDRQVAETSTGPLSKEDSVASGQEEGEEEAEAYQVIDSVEEPPNSAEDEHSVPEACESRAASSRTLKSKARTSLKNQESTATPKTSDFSKYLVVDSVQVEQTVGRRRSTRGKAQEQSAKISAKDEEPTFHVIDSVDDESSTTPRGTRGKRGRPPKRDAPSEDRAQEEKPATRRTYPLRTSQEGPQAKTKIEAIIKEEPSCQVLDKVKIPPAPRGRGRKGRPKKVVKTEENDDDDDDEEATTFQVVDSVDDETGQEMASSENAPHSPKQEDVTDGTSLVKLEDEEEPTYQVVDSLEEDPAEEEASVSDVCAPMTTEGGQTELRDETTEGENNQEADVKGEDAPSQMKTRSQQRSSQSPPLATKDDTPSTLALDQVSDEEEDFPDDGTKKPTERAEKEQKKSDWGLERDGPSKWRSRRREDEDELLTLDQVEVEEGGEQLAPESDVSEGELALVTLDELVEEQEEAKGPRPSSEGEQSEGCLNPETLLTLDETGGEEDEDEKSEAAGTSQSTKRKRSDDAEEDNINLVTLDQVGDVEEDVLRSTIEKRHRSASATISTGADQDEMEAAASGDAPWPPSDHHEEEKEEREKVVEKAENKGKEEEEGEEVEENTEKEKDNAEANEEEAPSAGQSLQGSLQKLSKGKRAAELTTTSAKRSRSESPCSTPAYVLPAFRPKNPLGMEFVLPKSGYFCKLCSVFYLKESTAKEVHCSSRKHYDNLKKYYRKCEQNSRSSTQGSISD
ncbi:zinc finger protein 638 isoform X5 [Syngnathus acus]|uniref:zinc finger protein 638 isoform X5 n=1 Tax=Syngnathus acus TaxID=161584 RepID=UPI001886062A|nr:zinc finger protein 638 isoform X5 [Syngnathus acus]